MKTSDQPLYISVIFSPFTYAEALQASEISPVSRLHLQPYTRGATAKNLTSTTYRKLLGQNGKIKSNRPLNPKQIDFRRMLSFFLQKDGGKGFAAIQLRLKLHGFGHLLSSSFRWQFDGRGTGRWLCFVLVVSLKTTVKKSGYDGRNISDGCTKFVLVRRKILFVSFVRAKHSLVLSFYICFCNFLKSLTFLSALCVNYWPPQIRKTCAHNYEMTSF